MGWICLFRCQIGRAGHPGTQLGNDDSETNRVIMSYWVHIMGGLGIVTSRPRLQGGTGHDLVVGTPPGGGAAVLQWTR